MGTALIINLWPVELREARNHFTPAEEGYPAREFVLKAAPPEGFSKLTICDQIQKEYVLRDTYRDALFSAREVALDIAQAVSKFSCGTSGRMGVFVWEGKPDPTDEQIFSSEQYRTARGEQDLLMRNIVEDARVSFARSIPLQRYHYMAADHLRIEGERWQDRHTSREVTTSCPYCKTIIQSDSVICANCKNVVDPVAYASLKAQIEGIPAPKRVESPAPVDEPVKSALTPAKQPVKA